VWLPFSFLSLPFCKIGVPQIYRFVPIFKVLPFRFPPDVTPPRHLDYRPPVRVNSHSAIPFLASLPPVHRMILSSPLLGHDFVSPLRLLPDHGRLSSAFRACIPHLHFTLALAWPSLPSFALLSEAQMNHFGLLISPRYFGAHRSVGVCLRLSLVSVFVASCHAISWVSFWQPGPRVALRCMILMVPSRPSSPFVEACDAVRSVPFFLMARLRRPCGVVSRARRSTLRSAPRVRVRPAPQSHPPPPNLCDLDRRSARFLLFFASHFRFWSVRDYNAYSNQLRRPAGKLGTPGLVFSPCAPSKTGSPRLPLRVLSHYPLA